jgi:hypothetical protein
MTFPRRYAVTLAACAPLVLLPAAAVSYEAAPDSPVTAVSSSSAPQPTAFPSPAPLPQPFPFPLDSPSPASLPSFLLQLGIPPCQIEDSPPPPFQVCVWDASVRGNHEGHSFLLFHDQVIHLS